jgi:hypothetical protein
MHPRHYTDKEYQELVDALQENSEKLLDGDGWTLVSAKYYLDLGVPETFVCPYWGWNESGEGKHAIFVDGEVVKGVYGIHNLEWLFGIARVLDVKYDSYGGRGFQARELCEAIKGALPNDSHIVDGVRKEA